MISHVLTLTPGGHPAVDFRDPLLPQLFCSHKDLNVQRRSCDKIRDLLQARGKRVLCLAVDETVWRPSFEAVARLQEGNSYSIVGGGWSPEKDCSVLATGDERKEEDLCKLSVSVVISRIDSNKLTVDANLVPLFQGTGNQKARSWNPSAAVARVRSQCVLPTTMAAATRP